jgi:hypothetical protein
MADRPDPPAAEHQPLLTVAIATYQRAAMARAAVERLAEQTFADHEVVVVDDGSTDGTGEALADLVSDRVRYVHQPNAGLCAARNAGLAAARGRYVVFLDDDDPPHPGLLARFAQVIEACDPGMVSCGTALVLPDGTLDRVTWPRRVGGAFGDAPFNHLPGAFAARRDVLVDVGGYLDGLQSHHQAELMLRLLPALEARGLAVVPVYEILMEKAHLPIRARREHQPRQLLDGMEAILAHHEATLAASPDVLSSYHAMAGVAAARCGDRTRARRHLLAAARARPTPRALGRVALSASPVPPPVWRY